MADINLNINAKNNASETIKRIAGETKGLENQFKKLGATIASAFAAREIFKFAQGAVNASREFNKFARSIASVEMAVGKFGSNASWKTILNNVNGQVAGLKKMSNQYGVVIHDVLSMRQELAEPLSFLDSNTINQLLPKLAAAGATMGISVGQMANEIDAVIDGRLKEKSSVLVKSLGMDVSAANKMGGTKFISELMTKLNSMESVFKEYAQSDEGKIAQFENTWSEFKKDLGTSLIPSLTTILESLKEPLERFSKTVSSPEFLKFIETIGTATGKAVNFAVEKPKTTLGIVAGSIAALEIGKFLLKGALNKVLFTPKVPVSTVAKSVGTGSKALEMLNTGSKVLSFASGVGKFGIFFGRLAAKINPALLVVEGILSAVEMGKKGIFTSSSASMGGMGWGMTMQQRKVYDDARLKEEEKTREKAEKAREKAEKPFNDFVNMINTLTESIKNSVDINERNAQIWDGYFRQQQEFAKNIGWWTDSYFGTKIGNDPPNKIKSQPIRVEISLKADMPYQASLSLTDSNGTQNKKIAPRVSDGRLIRG